VSENISSNTVRKTKVAVVFAATLIFVIIFFSYHFSIAERFSYMGFLLNPDSTRLLFVLGMSFLAITSMFFSSRDKYLVLFAFLFIVFFVLPSGIIYINSEAGLSPYIGSLSAYAVLLFVFPFIKTIRLANLSPRGFDRIILVLFLLCFSVVFYTHRLNLDFSALLFSDVYSARVASRERNWAGSVYAYFWLAKFICPMLILRGIDEKKLLFTILGSVAMLYMFLVTGHKSVFFGALITLGMYAVSVKVKKEELILIWALFSVFLTSWLVSLLFGYIELESMFIRRLLFIPSLLNVYYFDFFAGNYLYYSNSYLAGLLSYPYELMPPHLIGLHYFNSSEMSANNGIVSDGYMNFGYVGILFNITFTVYLLKLFRNSNIPPRYFGLMILFFYSIQGSSFSTVLLTHGGWLMFFYFSMVKYRAEVSRHSFNS
jgi:hypothetical protein